MTIFDRNDMLGQLRIQKYAQDTSLCTCETTVRDYVQQKHAEKLAAWKIGHPGDSDVTFGQLGIAVWRASYADNRIGRYKTVYADAFDPLLAELSLWVTTYVLSIGS